MNLNLNLSLNLNLNLNLILNLNMNLKYSRDDRLQFEGQTMPWIKKVKKTDGQYCFGKNGGKFSSTFDIRQGLVSNCYLSSCYYFTCKFFKIWAP